MYTYKYVERNGRSQGNNWSIRQTIVYHQRAADGMAIWIILHPKSRSVFQGRLFKAFSDMQTAVEIHSDPEILHVMLISSYIENWRWYLSQLSEKFQDAVRFVGMYHGLQR